MRARVAILLLLVAPIFAHHGGAGFDLKKSVHVSGKISRVEWINPHLFIHLDVTGADGTVTPSGGMPQSESHEEAGLLEGFLRSGSGTRSRGQSSQGRIQSRQRHQPHIEREEDAHWRTGQRRSEFLSRRDRFPVLQRRKERSGRGSEAVAWTSPANTAANPHAGSSAPSRSRG